MSTLGDERGLLPNTDLAKRCMLPSNLHQGVSNTRYTSGRYQKETPSMSQRHCTMLVWKMAVGGLSVFWNLEDIVEVVVVFSAGMGFRHRS